MTTETYTPRHQVLVVEDNRHQAAVMKRWLEDQGRFDVRTAGDGQLAASLLREQRWSLIVSDLNLPQRSGLDLLHQLRASDETTPFLLISGEASTQDACLALRERASDFLLKPLDHPTFVATVAALAGTFIEHVRRHAALESRLENRRHAQFLSAGRQLVSKLTSPLTRLSISADLLLHETSLGRRPSAKDIEFHRSAIDLAVRDAGVVLTDLKSLLGMGAAGIQQADLVAQAQSAMFLAAPALTARGITSALISPRTTVEVAGTAEGVRTVLSSALLSLVENATELEITGVEMTLTQRTHLPAARFTIRQRDAYRRRDLMDSLGTYVDMLMMTLGGFMEMRTEVEGTIITLAFQCASGPTQGLLQ